MKSFGKAEAFAISLEKPAETQLPTGGEYGKTLTVLQKIKKKTGNKIRFHLP